MGNAQFIITFNYSEARISKQNEIQIARAIVFIYLFFKFSHTYNFRVKTVNIQSICKQEIYLKFQFFWKLLQFSIKFMCFNFCSTANHRQMMIKKNYIFMPKIRRYFWNGIPWLKYFILVLQSFSFIKQKMRSNT